MLDVLQQVQPRVLLLTMMAVGILTLLAAYFYLFKAPIVEFVQLRQILTQSLLDMEAEKTGLDDRQIGRIQNEIEGLKTRLYGKGSELSPSQMVPYVIGELDRLSGPHQVQLISVKPGSVVRVLMFEEVPFDIEVTGKYFDLFSWLQRVEVELRPMVVKQIKLAPLGRQDSLKMKLRVVSYRPSERHED